jgi:23S rRNA (adenine2503-C2)-methyltransferase
MKVKSLRNSSHSESFEGSRITLPHKPVRDYKATIELFDGALIETGVFELEDSTSNNSVFHICVSTQAGCKFNCSFCASGKNGFSRNLTDQEIIGQIILLKEIVRIERFDHIVFMGIGEPLDNLNNVVHSIQNIISLDSWYSEKISLATVGVLPKLKELADMSVPLKRLWVSLHAAINEKRSSMIPIGKKYSVEETILGARYFSQRNGSIQTWVNYMVLNNFNDSEDDAKALADILSGSEKELSLMLTFPNGEISKIHNCENVIIKNFQKKLNQYEIKNEIAVFSSFGTEVNAGCGGFIFTPA